MASEYGNHQSSKLNDRLNCDSTHDVIYCVVPLKVASLEHCAFWRLWACGCATLSAFNLICHKGWVISQAAESLSGSQCILFLLKLMSSQATHSCWGSLALCAVYLEMSSSDYCVLWMALSVFLSVSLCYCSLYCFVGNVCECRQLLNFVFVSLDVSGYLPVILIGKLCNIEITAGLRNCTDNWSDW